MTSREFYMTRLAYINGLEPNIERIEKMKLPDIEKVSAKVHEAWMKSKNKSGVWERKSESGEELMVPYHRLSEEAKDLDRNTVKAVYAAISESL